MKKKWSIFITMAVAQEQEEKRKPQESFARVLHVGPALLEMHEDAANNRLTMAITLADRYARIVLDDRVVRMHSERDAYALFAETKAFLAMLEFLKESEVATVDRDADFRRAITSDLSSLPPDIQWVFLAFAGLWMRIGALLACHKTYSSVLQQEVLNAESARSYYESLRNIVENMKVVCMRMVSKQKDNGDGAVVSFLRQCVVLMNRISSVCSTLESIARAQMNARRNAYDALYPAEPQEPRCDRPS